MVSTKSRVTPARIGRMRAKYGDGLLKDLLLHRACDISGKGEGATTADIRKLGQMEAMRVDLAAGNVPASVKDLKITGYDLQALGVSGPDIGRVLRDVLDEVISQPDVLRLSSGVADGGRGASRVSGRSSRGADRGDRHRGGHPDAALRDAAASAAHRRSGVGMVRGVVPGAEGGELESQP